MLDYANPARNDVCTFDIRDEVVRPTSSGTCAATSTWAPPEPTLALDLDPTEIYEYEVLIFDLQRGRELVAAIELDHAISMDLEASYQQTSSALRLI